MASASVGADVSGTSLYADEYPSADPPGFKALLRESPRTGRAFRRQRARGTLLITAEEKDARYRA